MSLFECLVPLCFEPRRVVWDTECSILKFWEEKLAGQQLHIPPPVFKKEEKRALGKNVVMFRVTAKKAATNLIADIQTKRDKVWRIMLLMLWNAVVPTKDESSLAHNIYNMVEKKLVVSFKPGTRWDKRPRISSTGLNTRDKFVELCVNLNQHTEISRIKGKGKGKSWLRVQGNTFRYEVPSLEDIELADENTIIEELQARLLDMDIIFSDDVWDAIRGRGSHKKVPKKYKIEVRSDEVRIVHIPSVLWRFTDIERIEIYIEVHENQGETFIINSETVRTSPLEIAPIGVVNATLHREWTVQDGLSRKYLSLYNIYDFEIQYDFGVLFPLIGMSAYIGMANSGISDLFGKTEEEDTVTFDVMNISPETVKETVNTDQLITSEQLATLVIETTPQREQSPEIQELRQRLSVSPLRELVFREVTVRDVENDPEFYAELYDEHAKKITGLENEILELERKQTVIQEKLGALDSRTDEYKELDRKYQENNADLALMKADLGDLNFRGVEVPITEEQWVKEEDLPLLFGI